MKLNNSCDNFEIRPKSCNYFLTFEVAYGYNYEKYLQLESEEYRKEINRLKTVNSTLEKRMKKIIEIASKKRVPGGFRNNPKVKSSEVK